MAVISRRPRLPLYAALTVSLVLAACSLLKPVQAPEDRQERARGGGAGLRGTRDPATGRP